MRFVWSVFNTLGIKWLYDACVSIASIYAHNPEAELVVYYDVEQTREFLRNELSYIPQIIFIPDNGWCKEFGVSINANEYYGDAIFGIFRAMQQFDGCTVLDTDVYCYSPVRLYCNGKVGGYVRDGCLSRCIATFQERTFLPQKLFYFTQDVEYTDEIIFRKLLTPQPLKILGLSHFGQNKSLSKKMYADISLFKNVMGQIKNNAKIPAGKIGKYFKGVNDDCVL